MGQNTGAGLDVASGGQLQASGCNIYFNSAGVDKSQYATGYVMLVNSSIVNNYGPGVQVVGMSGGATDDVMLSCCDLSNNSTQTPGPQILSSVESLVLGGNKFRTDATSPTPTYLVQNTAGRVYWGPNRVDTTDGPAFSVAMFAVQSAVIGIFASSDTAPMTLGSPLVRPSYTVATLPAASAALKGATAYVTDATAPTFLGTLTGGGSAGCPVTCTGTAWIPG
jgi:hypothetical protein